MLDTKTIPSRYRSWIATNFLLVFAVFLFWLVTCPSWGQANQKRFLSKADYAQWSKLLAKNLSNEGNWASYVLMYESKKDTLFVKNTHNGVIYNFPYAEEGSFNGESEFACIARDTLMLQNLKTGKLTKTPNVTEFAFSGNEKFLLLFLKQPDNKQTLVVQDRNGSILQKISDVGVWQWHFEPQRNGIVYATNSEDNHTIAYMKLESNIIKKTIISDTKGAFQNLNWIRNTIAFIQLKPDNPILFSYTIEKDKLNHFDPKEQKGFPAEMKISDEIYNSLVLSDDGDRIFFWLKESPEKLRPIDSVAVQVWNTKDRLVFDHKKYVGQFTFMDKMSVWFVKSDRFLQITDRQIPKGFLSGDYAHAFIYDPIAYEPQNSFDSPIDLYMVNVSTGKRKLILEKYSNDVLTIPSPSGKYLAYVKEGNWWVYDIKKDTHTNITSTIPVSFFRQDQDKPIAADPYGYAGWTANDQSIIFYDQYDLWQISPDGKIKKRLTKGRELQRTYRIKNLRAKPLYDQNEIEIKKGPIQLHKGLILQAINKTTGASGFCKWSPVSREINIVWEANKVNQIIKAANRNHYIYVEQSYEIAPRLLFYDKSSVEITQTNQQQQHFYWGKAEPIHYTVNGKEVQGILYFPAGYQAGVKYPMIVHIYERQFQFFKDYENPTLHSGDGFNITNLSTQGYFVLLPDMVFEIGNVAQSATTCVLSAVDAVIAKGYVDSKKIGLNGHSFGGYQTDLIITQTNRFAAAVSGAAWTDLISSYLYVGTTMSKPDFYRAEHDQLRIGKSLFDDTESYLKSSPVLQASNVKTPLLAWTGEQDRHIHYLQSMEFYLALRRLNKTHTLLIYPKEGHNLEKRENQKDLSERMEQWFGYYLKSEKFQDWMKSDL